jgi:HemX protein
MFTERWVFDFVLYAYVLSLLFSYAALLRPNTQARVLSSSLLIVVWLTLTLDIVMRFMDKGHISGQIEPLLMYTWALISITLCISLVFHLDLFVFCTSLIGITVLTVHLFVSKEVALTAPADVITELVFVHITLAVSAYATFSLAGICAILYLISRSMLKKKKWNLIMRRLPSLENLEQFMIWLIGIGALLLLISLILGSVWAYQVYGSLHWTDVKVVGSLFLFLIYAVLFGMAWTRWIATQKIAWWVVFSMFFIITNYFLSKVHFSFHHWIS